MKKIVLVVILLVIIAVVVFGISRIEIKRIDCESQFGPCSSGIVTKLENLKGTPLFKIFGQAQKVLDGERRVSRYGLRYEVPSTLIVDLVERKAEVALGQQGFDGYVLVDKDGTVLGIEKATSLPVINVSGSQKINYLPGTRISDELAFAIKLTKYIFALYSVKLAVYHDDRIEFVIDSKKIIFPTNGDAEVLIGSLNLILSRLNKQEGEIRMGEIDLRYKNPIVR